MRWSISLSFACVTLVYGHFVQVSLVRRYLLEQSLLGSNPYICKLARCYELRAVGDPGEELCADVAVKNRAALGDDSILRAIDRWPPAFRPWSSAASLEIPVS